MTIKHLQPQHRIALAVKLLERLYYAEVDKVKKQSDLGADEEAYLGIHPALLLVKQGLRDKYGVEYNDLIKELRAR